MVGLHIHAASYFETTEQWPEAIHHYLRAGLQRQAARLIAKYGEDVVAEGRLGLVDEWLQQLPEETIKQNARLSLLFGEACGIRGDWDRALEALERARAYFARKGDRRLEALACLKLSSVYSNYGDAEASWRLADEGLELAPADATALRMRLEGDLALTRSWLTDGLAAVASACRRIAVEATSLGLEHYASIALHNLGYVETEMGRPSEAVGHLERAARFWADLPANPFADFSDLVQAVAATGDFERAHRLADVALDKTRSWPRPLAEAKLGKAQALAMQARYAEAVAVLRDALEQPEILGGGRIILGALLVDCIFLGQMDGGEIPAILDLMAQGPIDTRLRLRFEVANSVARHYLGQCGGECQESLDGIEHWASKGMIATTLNASLKLAYMALEHRDRRAVSRAVRVLCQLRDSELVRMNRGWARQLAPSARRFATLAEGAQVLADMVDADPEGWRLSAVDALHVLRDDNRALLLAAIVRNANRETTSMLHDVPGPDIAEAWRQLQVKQAPRIFIRLLGPLVVHRGSPTGGTVAISKRRMKGMLALLASHLGRPMSRDQVIETLWPEADYTAGVNNLNQTIFQLRRELDPSHREGESAPYVISTPESVHLHPDLVRTDVDEVRRQAGRISDGPLVRRREAAEAVLDLIRGEYLHELRYEPWAAPIQVRVHAELAGYLRPLMHADGVEISHEIGVRASCALLSLDEFDESAHFALIRQLAASGKRRAARVEADRYVERLRTDLDEEPSTDLQALLVSLNVPDRSTAV